MSYRHIMRSCECLSGQTGWEEQHLASLADTGQEASDLCAVR